MKPTKFICKWEKKRAKGFLKHILPYIVATPLGGLFGGTIGTIIGQGDVHKSFVKSSTIYCVIVLCLFGLGSGMYDWHRNERKYKLLTEKSK
ncbi:MAG: hypothetical protein P4L69_18000 [Desulfosporosinus sp.]|nr:hypothetical protein [Desulfosporosinus sp.]